MEGIRADGKTQSVSNNYERTGGSELQKHVNIKWRTLYTLEHLL